MRRIAMALLLVFGAVSAVSSSTALYLVWKGALSSENLSQDEDSMETEIRKANLLIPQARRSR